MTRASSRATWSTPSSRATGESTEALVRAGLAWSLANNLVIRAGGLAVGIVLAHLLTPRQFGVYAVALTVQTILMTLADLGLSTDLIRSADPGPRAPTVATLGIATGLVLTLACAASASPVAHLLGSPDATGAITVLALTIALGAVGIVPYAKLQRRFDQRSMFLIAGADLTASTVVTIALIQTGHGVVSLAIGRVVGQTVTVVLQFLAARMLPRFGWDRSLARSVVRFGVPVAATNLLSWALLSVDYVIVVRIVGPTALAFYVLAFNISNWPMTAVGQVVRSVSLPAFAQDRSPARSFGHALALTSALAALAGALLGGLSVPLVGFVYGAKWLPAAAVLAPLAIFGAFRVAFDLFASFLLARGASRLLLTVQIVWCATLVPALAVGALAGGNVGAGWAHVVVALGLVLPAYLLSVRSLGVGPRRSASALWPPLCAAAVSGSVGYLATGLTDHTWSDLVLGGVACAAVYVALLGRWSYGHLQALRSPVITAAPVEEAVR